MFLTNLKVHLPYKWYKNVVKHNSMKTQLSKTELKIADLISNGYLEKEIADKMCISHHTVHTHAKNIRKKWGCKNIADITRVFILSLPNIVFIKNK